MFENIQDKYINIEEVKKILCGVLKLDDYSDVRDYINYRDIKLTKEEIKSYLDNKFEEENPNLKRSIENRSNKKTTKYNADLFMKKFIEDLDASRYIFIPYTLKYYKKYSEILKIKLNKFLDIIDSINSNINYEEMLNLEKYDITINKDYLILKSDADRLIKPILYCLSNFLKTINEGNELETYLHNKISLDYIYRNGLNEADMYPSTDLQSDTALSSNSEYMMYTDKQKDMRIENFGKSVEYFINILESTEKRKVLN